MFGSVGIIPAAGNAERFGGYRKEMLPVNLPVNTGTLLQRTYISMMGICDLVVVVTRPELVQQQMKTLPPGAIFLEQEGNELMGAVKTVLKRIPHEFGGSFVMAMPDTYYPVGVFAREFDRDEIEGCLFLGLFETDNPERFGVYQDGKIRDKDQTLKGTHQKAWGVLMWDWWVARLWEDMNYPSFDAALNDALAQHPHTTFNIDYYYDMATFEDYKEFLCSLH